MFTKPAAPEYDSVRPEGSGFLPDSFALRQALRILYIYKKNMCEMQPTSVLLACSRDISSFH